MEVIDVLRRTSIILPRGISNMGLVMERYGSIRGHWSLEVAARQRIPRPGIDSYSAQVATPSTEIDLSFAGTTASRLPVESWPGNPIQTKSPLTATELIHKLAEHVRSREAP